MGNVCSRSGHHPGCLCYYRSLTCRFFFCSDSRLSILFCIARYSCSVIAPSASAHLLKYSSHSRSPTICRHARFCSSIFYDIAPLCLLVFPFFCVSYAVHKSSRIVPFSLLLFTPLLKQFEYGVFQSQSKNESVFIYFLTNANISPKMKADSF